MTWAIDGSLAMGNLDVIGDGRRICMIDCADETVTVSESDHEANARLIAAAPDLLAALEGAYKHFLQHMERDWFDDDDQDAMQKMFEAIDKAIGAAT